MVACKNKNVCCTQKFPDLLRATCWQKSHMLLEARSLMQYSLNRGCLIESREGAYNYAGDSWILGSGQCNAVHQLEYSLFTRNSTDAEDEYLVVRQPPLGPYAVPYLIPRQ